MTSKAALCYVLLSGQIVNIGNIHKLTGFTNAAREVGRSIERESGKGNHGFGVIVSRTKMEGKNRYGVRCTWVDYRMNRTGYNLPGIKKMAKYIIKEIGEPKTEMQRQMILKLKKFA